MSGGIHHWLDHLPAEDSVTSNPAFALERRMYGRVRDLELLALARPGPIGALCLSLGLFLLCLFWASLSV